MSTTKPLLLHVEWIQTTHSAHAADARAAHPPSIAANSSHVLPDDTHAVADANAPLPDTPSAQHRADGDDDTSQPADARSGGASMPSSAASVGPCRWFYKEGDDLLQDVATTLLLHEMNVAWAVSGEPFFTPIYSVHPLAHPPLCGFLECLPQAAPVSSVERFVYSDTLHASCVGSMVAACAHPSQPSQPSQPDPTHDPTQT
jgi:hypothetical protein